MANLGDSGLLVIRGTECVHRTEALRSDWNVPLQLSTHGDPENLVLPTMSHQSMFKTQPGDLVVMGTDGLLDNIVEADITRMVSAAKGKSLPSIAGMLKEQALKNARNTGYLSPFAKRAQEAGVEYRGGKKNDITIIVARVGQN